MVALAVVTFCGIILVVNPAFFLTYFGVDYSDQSAQMFVKDFTYYMGVGVGCFAAFITVFNNLLIAGMAQFTHPLQISFYAISGLTFTSGIFILFEEKDGQWLFVDYLYLGMYYFSMIMNQLSIFMMNKYEKRLAILSIILNFQVIWNFI